MKSRILVCVCGADGKKPRYNRVFTGTISCMLTPPVPSTPFSLGPLPHCNAPIRSQFSEVVESLLGRTHLLSTTPMLAFPWRLGPVVRLRASRAQRSRAQRSRAQLMVMKQQREKHDWGMETFDPRPDPRKSCWRWFKVTVCHEHGSTVAHSGLWHSVAYESRPRPHG